MQKEKRYFASTNSENGFISYYDKIYGSLDRVYIIKGGPGTGKSSFIRKIADEGEKNGCSVEYFYCSSDPLSLDGIIIEESKTAVIDGTLPHPYEQRFPGIRDKILNFGEFWDEDKLKPHASEICDIIIKKNQLYNNVYNYLAAAGRIEQEINLCNRRAILFDKMKGAVSRLSRGWCRGRGFNKIIRPVDGMSHTGRITYLTYHTMAQNRYTIKDRYGISNVFFEMLMKIAEQKELEVVFSPNFLNVESVCAVYLPEVSSSFVIADEVGSGERQINMDRFVDVDEIKRNKQKNRFARRCLNSLYEGVQKEFDEIFEFHLALEKYYIDAMDFSKTAELAQTVINEIFI